MEKFLDMTDLVKICIEKPLEGIKRKEDKLKDRAIISFSKK